MSIRQLLYVSSDQHPQLVTHCDHTRLLKNLAVDQFRLCDKAARKRGYKVSYTQQCRELTELRATHDWLRAGSVNVQQCALKEADVTRTRFMKGIAGYPKHKSRHSSRQSFHIKDLEVKPCNRKYGFVKIPKVGWLKFRLTKKWSEMASAKTATITFEHGKWHISFTTLPREKRTTGTKVTGIDRGVAITAMTSENEQFQAPSLTKPEQQRFLKLEQQFAKQTPGSKRHQATKDKLSKLRLTLKNRRTDWIEKTSTTLAEQNSCVVVEDLQIKNMTKRVKPKPDPDNPGKYLRNGRAAKSGLNRAILASLWGKLVQRISDKTEVIKVRAAYTSQTCNQCHHVSEENRDSQALFSCVKCGHTTNADLNAAMNIRDIGLGKLNISAEPGDTGCLDEEQICSTSTYSVLLN